jgi:two-component system sensor histidine kinase GlrK
MIKPIKLADLFSLKLFFLLGFALAAVPLLATVLYATDAMRETAALGKDRQVYEQTKAVYAVLQKASDIERKARLFVLLADPALRQPYERKSYEAARTAFKQALTDLKSIGVDNEITLLANELSEKEELIYRQIIASQVSFPKLPVDEAFADLREAANALAHGLEAHVDLELKALWLQNEHIEQTLLIKVAGLAVCSVLTIGLLLVSLGRSLRRLESALKRLGAGEWAVPIQLTGFAEIRRQGDMLESLRLRLLALTASRRSGAANEAADDSHP